MATIVLTDLPETRSGTDLGDTILAQGGNDLIFGQGGDDRIDGGLGDDELQGAAGADALFGGFGRDRLFGEAGDDSLAGGFDNDDLIGGDGNDILMGEAGADRFFGGGGFDRVSYATSIASVIVDFRRGVAQDGFGNTDALVSEIEGAIGSNFADLLIGSAGNQSFEGLGGSDTIDGLDGFDTVSFENSTVRVFVDLDIGARDNPATSEIYFQPAGFSQNELGEVDSLYGIEGVTGSRFNDVFVGSELANTLRGGDGADQISGEGGNDMLDGGNDSDILVGGVGADTLNGGAGVDAALYALSLRAVVVDLQSGVASNDGFGFTDRLSGIEYLSGSAFADTLRGSTNPAVEETFAGLAGNDVIDGRAGFDAADYSASPAGVVASLATGTASDGFGGTDRLIAVEGLVGSTFADRLTGAGAALERFNGLAGNDIIDGGAGRDIVLYLASRAGVSVDLELGRAEDGEGGIDRLLNIEGAVGSIFDDMLLGSGRAETFDGSRGNDAIEGGGGVDRADYDLAPTRVFVNLERGIAQDGFGTTDTLSGIESVLGSRFNDSVIGNAGINTILGGSGDDTIRARAGADLVNGGSGVDQLLGEAGADRLIGSLGGDRLYGGADADLFVYLAAADSGIAAAARDVIVDFQDGLDRIDLRAIDANIVAAGKQSFALVTGPFTAPGQIAVAVASGKTTVSGNINADLRADFAIDLTGAFNLTAADFVLL